MINVLCMLPNKYYDVRIDFSRCEAIIEPTVTDTTVIRMWRNG